MRKGGIGTITEDELHEAEGITLAAHKQLNRADEYLRAWVANMKRKPGTVERYKQITEEFLTLLGERAAFDLKSVETSDVQKFVNRDIALGRSGTTVTLNAKILRAVFNAAIRDGHIEKNPASSLALPDAVAEEREPFTPGEVETLLKATAGTDWHTTIALAAYAGLRLGDAVALKWSAVDLAKGELKFIPQKTSRKGKALTMPVGKRLLALLTKLAGTDAAQRRNTFAQRSGCGLSAGDRVCPLSSFG